MTISDICGRFSYHQMKHQSVYDMKPSTVLTKLPTNGRRVLWKHTDQLNQHGQYFDNMIETVKYIIFTYCVNTVQIYFSIVHNCIVHIYRSVT